MSSAAHSAPPDPAGLPAFLRFAPVPGRSRRDGWSADLQFRFVLDLARGAGVEEAARRLGRSRQSAYALRRRAGSVCRALSSGSIAVGDPVRRIARASEPDRLRAVLVRLARRDAECGARGEKPRCCGCDAGPVALRRNGAHLEMQ